MAQETVEEIQMEESSYDKLYHGNCGTNRGSQMNRNSSMYEDLDLPERVNASKANVSTKKWRSMVRKLTPKCFMVTHLAIAHVIIIVLISATLVVFLKRTSEIEASLKSLPKSEVIKELQMQVKALKKSSSILMSQCSFSCNYSSNSTGQTELNNTTAAPFGLITSCHKLPKSSPSGYYHVFSSNGSTMRVYCDMKKTCGNVTGGWMRVTSLDMRQPSSQCPSGLCLNTAMPRTCRRCNNRDQIYRFPLVTYHVGVSYSKVCGRLIAYQVGATDGFNSQLDVGFDGITIMYGAPLKMIWGFVVALSRNENVWNYFPLNICPCMNPKNKRISPPLYLGNQYFCDAGSVARITRPTVFYTHPLWDGQGCSGSNQCCSFNSPPWFYRELSGPTREPIKMRVNLDEEPSNEDLAIERVDLYVQ